MDKKQKNRVLLLTIIARRLSKLKDNKGKIFVVGGLVVHGYTAHDIDIVIEDQRDIPKVKKVLGPYFKDVHFSPLVGKRPASKTYLIIENKPRKSLGNYPLYA